MKVSTTVSFLVLGSSLAVAAPVPVLSLQARAPIPPSAEEILTRLTNSLMNHIDQQTLQDFQAIGANEWPQLTAMSQHGQVQSEMAFYMGRVIMFPTTPSADNAINAMIHTFTDAQKTTAMESLIDDGLTDAQRATLEAASGLSLSDTPASQKMAFENLDALEKTTFFNDFFESPLSPKQRDTLNGAFATNSPNQWVHFPNDVIDAWNSKSQAVQEGYAKVMFLAQGNPNAMQIVRTAGGLLG